MNDTLLVMKKAILLAVLMHVGAIAQDTLFNYSANLPATDALGRKLPTSVPRRKNKFVGLFYWTWHYEYQSTNNKPINLSKFLRENPKLKSNSNYDDPSWPKDRIYFWGEPLFGFYTSTDEWVLYKHAEMLADADVDVIIFDCTNGDKVWKPAYTALCETFMKARKNGIRTPQIAFMTALGPVSDGQKAINQLYGELYLPGLYKELWFYWKGKPLLLGYPDMMTEIPGNPAGSQLHQQIRNFFTFRPVQPDYKAGPVRPDQWGWLEIYPQHGFVKKPGDGYEEMTVGVAQNWSKQQGLAAMNTPGSFGRSYTSAKGQDNRANAYLYGLNFQEQWNRALKQDIEFIFITGWNEWVVNRQREWSKQPNAFPDEYNTDKSRDIEPAKGELADNYYYQMVSNIRRFKGVPAEKGASASKTIRIDGFFDDWRSVQPDFKAHKGSTLQRNSPGFQSYQFVNKTGRNDIVRAKVARDKDYVYFYVETASPLTPNTDPNWMTLFIDLDRKKNTGWEGYDFAVNRSRTGKTAIVEKIKNGKSWAKVVEVQYAYKGNGLELRVPRMYLQNSAKRIDLEFKWSDNRQKDDIMDFWQNGDVAPSGRYNYHFKAD